MYHPSVYDNLKVVLEGAIYDLDFSGEIEIVNRKDLLDHAIMERNYSVDFVVSTIGELMRGNISLTSTLEDLAMEKLNDNPDGAGSKLSVCIQTPVYEIETDCKQIQSILKNGETVI